MNSLSSARLSTLLIVFLNILFVPMAEQRTALTSQPTFEVATVKPSPPNEQRTFITGSPDRFTAVAASLRSLVAYAYRLRDFQIVGGPVWANSDRWAVDAKMAPEFVSQTRTDLAIPDTKALMVQSLLNERFKLKIHWEKRDLPAYALMFTKTGSKLKISTAQSSANAPASAPTLHGPLTPGSWRATRGLIEGNAVPLSRLVNMLSTLVGRPIVDKTDLTALYEFSLHWTPDQTVDPGSFSTPSTRVPDQDEFAWPALTTALKEQLGLQLEDTKAPLDVLVIESAERPTSK
jgi:uncharacterized protein (TIGR03435 family)